jgi:hypothetical protein
LPQRQRQDRQHALPVENREWMDTNEWCAIAHIDFRPSFADRGALIAAVQAGKGRRRPLRR